MTKPGTTRVNAVVSNRPVAVRFRKFLTDSGACSGNISISITPASVSKVTHCAAIVFMSALSKGSALAAVGFGVGRALVLTGSFIIGVADGVCPNARNDEEVRIIKNTNDLTMALRFSAKRFQV